MNDGLITSSLLDQHGLTPDAQRAGIGDAAAFFARAKAGQSIGGPGNAYSQVGAVYACVKARINALSSMPLMVGTEGDQVVESGPLVDLAENPHPTWTRRRFWRATEANLCLLGMAIWIKTGQVSGRPTAVLPASPLQIRPLYRDQDKTEIIGWRFRPIGGRQADEMTLEPEEVYVIAEPDYMDVSDQLAVVSPRHAAAHAIAQFWKADLANEASLDNGVEPGGAFTMAGTLTELQKRSLREDLEMRAGVRNRRHALILQGGMEWQQIASGFAEMEFSQLKAMSRTDICAAFEVPPSVAGYFEDSNYAHADSADRTFWTTTILSRAEWLAEEWDACVVDAYQGDQSLTFARSVKRCLTVRERVAPLRTKAAKRSGRTRSPYYTWFDTSGVTTIQRAQLELAESAKKWIDMGVPLNQVIERFDLPYDPPAWGNTWYKPMGLVDVQEDTAINDPPGGGDDDGLEDLPLPEDDGAVDPVSAAAGRTAPARPVVESEERTLSEKQLTRIWTAWRSSWQPLEKRAASRWRRHFMALRRDALQRLERNAAGFAEAAELQRETIPAPNEMVDWDVRAWDKAGTPVTHTVLLRVQQRDLIAEVLFDLVQANQDVVKLVGPTIREAFGLGGSQAMAEAAEALEQDTPDSFSMDDPEVIRSLRQREIQITRSNQTLRRRLADQLADGVSLGETQEQLSDRIRKEFNFASKRAGTIARTEVGTDVETAREIGRKQAGTPLKSWLWSRQETGREWHGITEVNTLAEPVAVGSQFTIATTGHTCDHPRANNLPASERVNCGCTTLARYPGDRIRDVMARYLDHGFISYVDRSHNRVE